MLHRFIEYMPFGGTDWSKGKMVPSRVLLSRIGDVYPYTALHATSADETSKRYWVPGFEGSFGFISSMSDHFCSSCSRLRLTADGGLKVCLFGSEETNLREMLRNGSSDEEIVKVIGDTVMLKKASHGGMDEIAKHVNENRPMITIGG